MFVYHSARIGLPDYHHLQEIDTLIRMLAAKLEGIWQQPDAGMWESRGRPHHHTYSKAMCWVAFDRAAAWLCDRDADLSERYRRLAANVREEVLEKGFDRRRNSFVRAYDDDALDAAVLRLPFVGLIDPCDERMIGTVAAIERELVSGGLVWRYRSEDTDDGLEQGEGAFVAAGFWLADALQCRGGRTRPGPCSNGCWGGPMMSVCWLRNYRANRIVSLANFRRPCRICP